MSTKAIKVTLRKKAISGNKESLYLDFYPPKFDPETGEETRREFLNLFLFSEIETRVHHYTDKNGKDQKTVVPVLNKAGNPKTRRLSNQDREHNKNTLELAEGIRNRRVNEINKPLIYSGLETERLAAGAYAKASFLEYFKDLAEHKTSKKEKESFTIVHKHLTNFSGGSLAFCQINKKLCSDFRAYLLNLYAYNGTKKKLHQNTAAKYQEKFKQGLKTAYKEKRIPANIADDLDPIRALESTRNFLTLEELNILAKTDCKDPALKRAFLFSALTGLRKGDIESLTWGKIERINNIYAIRITLRKTQKPETLWISDQAFELLGTPGQQNEKVFPGLIINSYYVKHLQYWFGAAGITKDISFHSARHSFATLQLANGTDLKTVSKLLGHKSVRTTEIYAKVVDRLRQEAVDRIKLDL